MNTRRVDNDSNRKSIVGSRNAGGCATDERKRMGIAERGSECARNSVQESCEKEGAEIGYKAKEFVLTGGKRKGKNPKNREDGGLSQRISM